MCGSALAEVEISSSVNPSLKHIFICELSLILFEFYPNRFTCVFFIFYNIDVTGPSWRIKPTCLILICLPYLKHFATLCIHITPMIYVYWQGWKEKDLPLNNARVVQLSECCVAVIQSALLIYLSNMFADLSSENTMRQEQ